MPYRKQSNVDRNLFEPVEKENDAGEKQQVVVPGDHMFGAKIYIRSNLRTCTTQQERLVVSGNTVRERKRSAE